MVAKAGFTVVDFHISYCDSDFVGYFWGEKEEYVYFFNWENTELCDIFVNGYFFACMGMGIEMVRDNAAFRTTKA